MSSKDKELEVKDPELRDDSAEARTLPLLPVRDTVLFPHAVLPLTVGRESSVQLINSLGEDKTIVVVAQREAGDMDKALQTAIQDLRKDFNMLFERYNTLLAELSSLHVTEDALKAKTGA